MRSTAWVENAYRRATKILTENKAKLGQIAKYLVENETLEGDELQTLFNSPPPDLDASPPDDTPPSPDLVRSPVPAV